MRCSHGYLCWATCKWFCIWSSWCHCHPVISCFIEIQTGLTFLVLAYPACPGNCSQGDRSRAAVWISLTLPRCVTHFILHSTKWSGSRNNKNLPNCQRPSWTNPAKQRRRRGVKDHTRLLTSVCTSRHCTIVQQTDRKWCWKCHPRNTCWVVSLLQTPKLSDSLAFSS